MTETKREAKLVQYLSEAYGKEKELETALEAHIGMTTRKPYKKRLQDHLKETKSHARSLESGSSRSAASGPQLIDKVAGQASGQGEVACQGPAAPGPRRERGREDAQEREDRVLQRARGDRHLHRDRDARRSGRRQGDGEAGARHPPRRGADGEVPRRPDPDPDPSGGHRRGAGERAEQGERRQAPPRRARRAARAAAARRPRVAAAPGRARRARPRVAERGAS